MSYFGGDELNNHDEKWHFCFLGLFPASEMMLPKNLYLRLLNTIQYLILYVLRMRLATYTKLYIALFPLLSFFRILLCVATDQWSCSLFLYWLSSLAQLQSLRIASTFNSSFVLKGRSEVYKNCLFHRKRIKTISDSLLNENLMQLKIFN